MMLLTCFVIRILDDDTTRSRLFDRFQFPCQPCISVYIQTDEEVIKACRVHMRGACGDSLDHMEGSNYKVYTQPSIYELVELPVPYLCINSMVWYGTYAWCVW